MALTKEQVRRPVLPKRAVDVPELGGEVIVRGLLLKDRLALIDMSSADKTHGMERVSKTLAATVVDPDGQPLLTVEEWEEFGAENFAAAMNLFGVAMELSGFKTEVLEKN